MLFMKIKSAFMNSFKTNFENWIEPLSITLEDLVSKF